VSLSGKLAPYGLILKIKNVTTRAAAESLKNHELAIARRHLAPLEADEYYHFDLLNLEAFLDNGQRLGRVVDLLPTAASLVLVIRDENGWENLAPFTEETIPEVDLVAGRLVVVDCPGLLQPRPTS
jgi:16S rRNA processing protein RimM